MDMGGYGKVVKNDKMWASMLNFRDVWSKYVFSDFDFRYVGKSGGVPKVVQKAWGAEISLIMEEYGSFLGKSTDLS